MKNDASERYLRYEKLKTLGLPVPDPVWTRVDEEWNSLERLVSDPADWAWLGASGPQRAPEALRAACAVASDRHGNAALRHSQDSNVVPCTCPELYLLKILVNNS